MLSEDRHDAGWKRHTRNTQKGREETLRELKIDNC